MPLKYIHPSMNYIRGSKCVNYWLPESWTNITIDFDAITDVFQDIRYIGELRLRWDKIKKLRMPPIYGLTIVEADITRNIPIAFNRKEISRNLKVVILEIPIKLTPISSGSGEAIITAPRTGSVQLKYLV